MKKHRFKSDVISTSPYILRWPHFQQHCAWINLPDIANTSDISRPASYHQNPENTVQILISLLCLPLPPSLLCRPFFFFHDNIVMIYLCFATTRPTNNTLLMSAFTFILPIANTNGYHLATILIQKDKLCFCGFVWQYISMAKPRSLV